MCLCVWFQGIPGTPGLQGPPGAPGDPGERVSECRLHFTADYKIFLRSPVSAHHKC